MTLRARLLRAGAAATLLASCGGAAATPDQLVVSDVWSRAPAPTSPAAAFYLEVVNGGDAPAELVSATSSACAEIQIHRSSSNEAGVVTMGLAAAGERTVAAGQTLVFSPNGMHLMCMGLRAELAAGDTVDLELVFEPDGQVSTSVEIRNP